MLESKRYKSLKKVIQATTGNDYESKLGPTGYFWTHGYKVVKRHISVTCTKRNYRNMEKSTRSYTIGGSTKNSVWVAGSFILG